MFSCGPLVDCASRPRPPQTLKNETPPGCPSPGGLPLECAHLGIVEEEDPHEALRAYARLYLGAPPLASDDVLEAAGPISTADDFRKAFRKVLQRRGWPVRKCANGRALRRCFMINASGELTWGSKKEGKADKSVPVSEITRVTREAFDDGPPDANPNHMLVIIIAGQYGLKILCESEADACVLWQGFSDFIPVGPRPI